MKCLYCDEYEVGTFVGGSTTFCSGSCADLAVGDGCDDEADLDRWIMTSGCYEGDTDA